jgi:hypothetical protein
MDYLNGFESQPKIGNVVKKLRHLGRGGTGSVYHCRDQYNNNFAVKVIETHKHGILCLEEPFIMSSLDHPFLNKSFMTLLDKGCTNIYQPLAVNNMTEFTRRNIGNYRPDNSTSTRWIYQLLE